MTSVEKPWSSVEVALAACSLILGVFAVGTMLAIGYLNYTSFPWFDAWDYWTEYLNSGNPLSVLFDRMNEHRIVVTRLLQLADLAWFRADARLLLWATYLIQFGSVFVLYRMATAAFPLRPVERVYAAGLILTFAFAAGQWINFTWLFLNGFLMIPFAVMSAFVMLKNGVKEGETHRSSSMPWTMASIAMALVATGSLANGLLVWPLLIAMAATLRLPGKDVALIALVGVLTVLAYVSGDSRATNSHLGQSLSQPWIILAFALACLGSAFDEPLTVLGTILGQDWASYRIPVTVLAGAIGLVAATYLTVSAVTRRASLDRHRIAMLYTLAFFIATSLLIGVGRTWLPLTEALTSRYVTFSLLFFACLVVMGTSAAAAAGSGLRRYGIRFAALILAAFVGGLPQLSRVAYAADTERFLAEGEYALINDVYAMEAWYRFYYAPGKMIPIVRYFRDHQLSLFKPDWTTWLGHPVSHHFTLGDSSSCTGAWESSSPVGGSYTPAVQGSGWAYNRKFGRAPDLIIFADALGRIVGYASGTRRRLDLSSVLTQAATQRVGWVAFLPAGIPVDLTAYARLGDGRTLCRLAGRHLPGTFLTVALAKAGPVIPGVEAVAQGDWMRETLPAPLAATAAGAEVWTSRTLKAGEGLLRLGPVPCSSGTSIGLPLVTSSPSSSIRVSIVERRTGNLLAVAVPSPGLSGADLWRLDVPVGAPAMTCDFVVEDKDGNQWVAAGWPRVINP